MPAIISPLRQLQQNLCQSLMNHILHIGILRYDTPPLCMQHECLTIVIAEISHLLVSLY